MKKPIVILSALALLFAFGVISAQETGNDTQAVALDENVTAEDLGVQEPTVLPDSPFYFLKNWGREIQSAFTFNPIKKTELREKFANEKLIELKKVTEKTQNSNTIKKATENYRKEIEKTKKAAENIKETTAENPQVGTFLDKFIQQQTLHQRILEKLETQVSTTTFAKIQEAREQHLERFGEVMNRLEANKEKLQERLETNLEKVKGSEFKNFKNLEMLKALEEKVPEAAKEAIQKAQENVLKRLQGDVEKMSPEDQTKFQDYIEKTSGAKEKQLEIIENIRTGLQEQSVLKEKLRETFKDISENLQKFPKTDCPTLDTPLPSCLKLPGLPGRVVQERDEKGCLISLKCVMPADETNVTPNTSAKQACVTLWDPVCGKDGKTYSNACFAKMAGVEIVNDDACKSLETGTSPQIREQIKSLVPKLTP